VKRVAVYKVAINYWLLWNESEQQTSRLWRWQQVLASMSAAKHWRKVTWKCCWIAAGLMIRHVKDRHCIYYFLPSVSLIYIPLLTMADIPRRSV